MQINAYRYRLLLDRLGLGSRTELRSPQFQIWNLWISKNGVLVGF